MNIQTYNIHTACSMCIGSCKFETDCKKNLYANEWVSSDDQKEWLCNNCEVIIESYTEDRVVVRKKYRHYYDMILRTSKLSNLFIGYI